MSAARKWPSNRVRIGSFELDVRSGELCTSGPDGLTERVVLKEQPFQVLRLLVEHGGRIVTRSEMKKTLWPNDTIVDFDHSINVAIGVLRKALGDSAARPRYIETLARRGYRLIAAVEWLDSAPGDRPVLTPEVAPLGNLTGKKVCQYRVLEVLGGGGMGMVYKAEDLKLGRRAALKFLPEELAGDPIALRRLELEAQTASALNHPNICTIYDIEEYAGHPFIAMELLEGETLQQRLATAPPKPIPLPVLMDIASQVCLGLEAAHAQSIIHRDIKPGNIFLTQQGTVKLLDFGVAKQVIHEEDVEESAASDTQREIPRRNANLTLPGVTVGTAGYMSPEQVRREKLDGRSDLFSFGLVLYEAATGKRGFTGETAADVQEAILTRTLPAVGLVNPEIPAGLRAVIGKALEKNRSQRYQSAEEMRRDLDRWREVPTEPSKTRRTPRLVAAIGVLVMGVLAVWAAWRNGSGIRLAANDTLVLAHFTNHTSSRVFEEALYTALRIALEQTPYLNVLADDKLRRTLPAVGVEEGASITPEIALQVCRRTGSRIVIAPSIRDAGNRLRLELKAIACQSGSAISQVATEAASRDGVVSALGAAAVRLRGELGEPEAWLTAHNVPLEKATSASPEALELLTLGYRQQLAGRQQEAIALYHRAVQADSNLALAHAALSTAYGHRGDATRSAAYGRTAFESRGALTAPLRFHMESTYYREVTGEWDKSCAVLSDWVQAFPHDVIARNNFSRCLAVLGEADRALGEAREAARLLPAPHSYSTWVYRALQADRLEEADATMKEALRRGFDSVYLRDLRVRLAFIKNDDAGMQRLWAAAAGRTDADLLFLGKSMVEAYRGMFRAAARSLDTVTALTAARGLSANPYTGIAALREVEAGLLPARPSPITPAQSLHARIVGSLALARGGWGQMGEQAAAELARDYPANTIVHQYAIPLVAAAAMLAANNTTGAITALRPLAKYELALMSDIPGLYPAYLRGLAYLQAGDAAAAAGEFTKVIAHPGLVGREIIGPLSRLQLARAHRAMGRDTAARESYEAFLSLWRNADAGIPAYQQARTEYAELGKQLRAK